MIVMPTYSVETIRPLSNDERRAEWAMKFFCAGNHHEQGRVVDREAEAAAIKFFNDTRNTTP